MDALSPAAREVLGTVAACTWSGPHRATPLRRFTRLTPADFDLGFRELARNGLVQVPGPGRDLFWVTHRGELLADRMFG